MSSKKDWQWDEGQLSKKGFGLDFMIDLHNKCGRQIFKYYKEITDEAVDI